MVKFEDWPPEQAQPVGVGKTFCRSSEDANHLKIGLSEIN